MKPEELSLLFARLSTALVSDACLRLQLPVRVVPQGIRPLLPSRKLAGRALPVRHYGSVDIFLEALETSRPGDVLVIDNGGRLDEGCIGDLIALEAREAGLAGIVIWGAHRDTAELAALRHPVFSYGVCPWGPRQMRPRQAEALGSALFGDLVVDRDDIVFADDDGILLVAGRHLENLLPTAASLAATEREQASMMKQGTTLRQQLSFADYVRRRRLDPDYTFRAHLQQVGGAVEE